MTDRTEAINAASPEAELPLNREMRDHIKRLRWTPGLAGDVLGRNRKTIKRWIRGTMPVEVTDLSFVREVVAFADHAREMYLTLQAGVMNEDEFRAIVEALGWSTFNQDPNSFAAVCNVSEESVRAMALGQRLIPFGWVKAFWHLNKLLDVPPFRGPNALAREEAEAEADKASGVTHG